MDSSGYSVDSLNSSGYVEDILEVFATLCFDVEVVNVKPKKISFNSSGFKSVQSESLCVDTNTSSLKCQIFFLSQMVKCTKSSTCPLDIYLKRNENSLTLCRDQSPKSSKSGRKHLIPHHTQLCHRHYLNSFHALFETCHSTTISQTKTISNSECV